MREPASLTANQQALAILGAVVLLALVMKLIYDRRLREDYAGLWFAFTILILVFAIWEEGLRSVARALDALTLTAPVFVLSILFLTLVAIHFSVELTRLTRRLNRLAQRLALMEASDKHGEGEPRAHDEQR
ncbi:MAG: DUF2304 domain-containing protein [Elusimicrobia bacterium]|nr:DUF2304 domain-containing protein [Elusimicrobiota bacterium]